MHAANEQKSVRQTMNVSRLAIRYPRLTIGFWLAVVVAGLIAFGSLRYALFPDITFPVVIVNATGPEATTSLAMESEVTIPIEERLKRLENLDDIISTTAPGRVSVRVSFQVGTDLETARKATRKALSSVILPEGTAVETVSLNLNESSAVTYVVQSSSLDLDRLSVRTEARVVRPVCAVKGVLKVRMLGLLQPPTTMTDSAQLEISTPTQVRFNGEAALALEVIKTSQANTIDLVKRVEEEIEKIRAGLPDIQIIQASTQAHYIEEASNATMESIAIAIALSVIVIYPFLWNWPATLIAALAIPTSLLGTFIVMAICGFNLETITLLAIALVVGIIVDDAIVDVENISRHLDMGKPPREAAVDATDEVGLTVTAATLTIAAVFLPVGLMGGVVGQFFRPFGITVSAAVLISLLVARTLSPLLSMWWLRKAPPRAEGSRWRSFLNGYDSLLNWSLGHRYLVVAATIFSLVLGIGLVFVVDKGFIPRLDRGVFIIRYVSQKLAAPGEDAMAMEPGDRALKDTAMVLLHTKSQAIEIENLVRHTPDVEDVLMTVGTRWGEPDSGDLLVRLKKDRPLTTTEIKKEIRDRLAALSGLKISVEDIPFVDTGSEQPIQIRLHGSNLKTLNETALKIKDHISGLPGLVDVSTTASPSSDQGDQSGSADGLIERENGRRVRYIRANINPHISVDQAVQLIDKATRRMLPNGITMTMGGDSQRIGEILKSFASTMILGIVCIIAVLYILFKSWSDPLIIAFSLPLSLVGAMLALILTGHEFGMISVIGVIFLMGLTNKNAIIMVDYINQLRQTGLARKDAVLKGASVRLRPILMTTAATILGMLPVALGLGAGSELRAPMAIAIMGGLMASSLLSLLVIPVMYSLFEGLRFKMARSAG
ncbi:MAG: cation transporter [Cyanobium sp. CACIAM 14]|nr:MAG: cation transporter [Cyanobium sp. CACIAM 14]